MTSGHTPTSPAASRRPLHQVERLDFCEAMTPLHLMERSPSTAGEVGLNTLWGTLIVDELVKSGCTMFCVAPGSRSTPLTVAAARHEGAQTMICHDERSLGFFALGHARATGQACAIIVTSGTAVANLFPAICEAFNDEIPLIALTADRPPELRDIGANQTMDQVQIFGTHVRHFVDLPAPDDRISSQFVSGVIAQAYEKARHGPVQVNCMFREPLI